MRFAVEVSQPGPVRLRLNANEGITAWIDGTRVEPTTLTNLDLAVGRHVITLALDPEARPVKELSAELVDVPGSSARAQVVLDE